MQEFAEIEYNTWLEQLRKELKTDNLSVKHVDIDHKLKTDPFFQRNSSGDKGLRQTSSWSIAERFSARDHGQADIMSSLTGGINAIILEDAEALKDASIFTDIILNYVKSYLHFARPVSDVQCNELIGILSTLGADHFQISVSHLSESQISLFQNAGFTMLRYFHLDQLLVVEQLTQITVEIIAYLDAIEDTDARKHAAKNIVIQRSLSTDIVREIAVKQAIDVLWNQILKGFSIEGIALRTHAECAEVPNETVERQYIALASKGLTAVTASYDLVHVKPAHTERMNFHRRISRNIQHLLQLESLMENYRHAYDGSYQIEHISKEIATEVWNNTN